MFDWDNAIALHELQKNRDSSCESVVGDSLEFNQANRGSLCV